MARDRKDLAGALKKASKKRKVKKRNSPVKSKGVGRVY